MNADVDLGQLVTLNEAAEFLPGRKRVSYSTWWRWFRKGIKGVRLWTVVVGHRRYTTRDAVEEFIVKVTAVADGKRPPVRTPRQRQRAIEQAQAEIFGGPKGKKMSAATDRKE